MRNHKGEKNRLLSAWQKVKTYCRIPFGVATCPSRRELLGENKCILALNQLLPAVAEMAFIWNPLLVTNELFCGACQLLMKLDFTVSLSCTSQTLFPFCQQWWGAGSTAPRLGQTHHCCFPSDGK